MKTPTSPPHNQKPKIKTERKKPLPVDAYCEGRRWVGAHLASDSIQNGGEGKRKGWRWG